MTEKTIEWRTRSLEPLLRENLYKFIEVCRSSRAFFDSPFLMFPFGKKEMSIVLAHGKNSRPRFSEMGF